MAYGLSTQYSGEGFMERILLIFFMMLSLPSLGSANSCCGQSPASFTVLSLDQIVSVNTAYSYIESQGRMLNSDEFYLWDSKKRRVHSLQLNIAGTIADRQQYFISTALLNGSYQDSRENGSAQHLNDTQLGYTYEILPEYSFSYWRPVVYLSLMANLPTGNSIYDESKLSEGADVTGHNQWGLGVGLTLRKVYFPLTLTFQTRTLRLFEKDFGNLQVSDFYDSSLALLANYATSFSNIALNLGVTTNHLSARTISPGGTSQSLLNSTIILGLQKVFDDNWSAGLNYSDQTLVGPAKNSILNRTVTLNMNYNYF